METFPSEISKVCCCPDTHRAKFPYPGEQTSKQLTLFYRLSLPSFIFQSNCDKFFQPSFLTLNKFCVCTYKNQVNSFIILSTLLWDEVQTCIYIEVRGQLVIAGSLLLPCESQDQTPAPCLPTCCMLCHDIHRLTY